MEVRRPDPCRCLCPFPTQVFRIIQPDDWTQEHPDPPGLSCKLYRRARFAMAPIFGPSELDPNARAGTSVGPWPGCSGGRALLPATGQRSPWTRRSSAPGGSSSLPDRRTRPGSRDSCGAASRSSSTTSRGRCRCSRCPRCRSRGACSRTRWVSEVSVARDRSLTLFHLHRAACYPFAAGGAPRAAKGSSDAESAKPPAVPLDLKPLFSPAQALGRRWRSSASSWPGPGRNTSLWCCRPGLHLPPACPRQAQLDAPSL